MINKQNTECLAVKYYLWYNCVNVTVDFFNKIIYELISIRASITAESINAHLYGYLLSRIDALPFQPLYTIHTKDNMTK